MRIAIVGGGMMGLSLAHRLCTRGHKVCVFERERQLGGLATYHDYGPFIWDRFYHVILPTDGPLTTFLDDIGLGDRLQWQTTLTGFYVDRQFYSLSNSLDFLRFPPLSLWSKFRLALTILYCARIEDWRALEKVSVEEWLIRVSGRATYEKMWKPLLLAKLGENYRRVSAVFIWTYVKRMFSARDTSAQKEALGYISGGYKAVFDRLESLITQAGGEVLTGVTVEHVASATAGGLRIRVDGEERHFDKVIFTSPVNVLEKVADPGLVSVEGSGSKVEYLGVICVVLVSRKPLVPYYIVNIADSEVPFTGIIGMSNVVSTDETNGMHITYLPKYVHSEDPTLRVPDSEIERSFFAGLRRMFPNLDETEIVSVHINRAVKVQPLQVLNFSQIVPKVRTKHEDFFVLNTAQLVNNTLNNNAVVQAVNQFMESHGGRFDSQSSAVTEQRYGT